MSTKMKVELLPNEIFIECFQYLNALDIFYSFDQLNSRFHTLLRNIPLHLNFHQHKNCLLNEFCQLILSNPEIEQNIISLKLFNVGTHDQIQSLFSLNEFNCLQSISLLDLNGDNVQHLSPICDLSGLCQLFQYTPMLKYLKIESLYDSQIAHDALNRTYLKECIVKHSSAKFEVIQLLLKCMPNLNSFSLSAPDRKDMIDADRWQHFIETSLVHLHEFKFNFSDFTTGSYRKKFIKLQKFQTDFWHKHHHWYTNYDINKFSASIYTMPYIRNEYKLIFPMKRYINPLTSNSNGFKNVKDLTIWTRTIKNNSSFYFPKVHSLTLTCSLADDYDGADKRMNGYDLSETQIKYLHKIVNLSSVKRLRIENNCHISSSLLLDILETLLNVSSLVIDNRTLFSFLKNRELCEYLKNNITTLDISSCCRCSYIKSNDIDLLCKTFPNLQRLVCNVQKLKELLLLLEKSSKLLMIKLGKISQEIFSWIKTNSLTLNVYLDCTSIDYQADMTTCRMSELDLIENLFC